LLGLLKAAGLTGVKVLWTFFERRVQPLKARAHPLFRYSGVGDPTRASPEVLEPTEVRSRVWTVIKRRQAADNEADLDYHEAGQAPHPAARREGNDPFCVSLVSLFHFVLADFLPELMSCLVSAPALKDVLPAPAGGRG
ncbi:hypothetical protein BAE44_0004735, partial [Dichanthelium oligosanthes]